MHLDAEVVAIWIILCEPEEQLAVAESDLERAGRVSTVSCVEVERGLSILDAVTRPELRERACLCAREPPLAAHEAANGASGDLSSHGRAAAPQKIVPSTGDDALAKRLRGIRPARKASRPASTALRMADAMRTGSRA